MTPDVVVDIGNTRIKWGWMPEGAIGLKVASLPPDDETAWNNHLTTLPKSESRSWAVASVHPARLERFSAWAKARGEALQVIDRSHIPLNLDVDEPLKVGIDRLLNALAARRRCPEGEPVVIIDAGSAVTVDLLDEHNVFRGGAILPGPRLMARSLHEYTAKLPELPIHEIPSKDPPGRNTEDAITVGIMAALMGGCAMLVEEYMGKCSQPPTVLMTGGALGYLVDFDFANGTQAGGPFPLTLEGIRIAAEALP
ncbi:MAG: hypothetical protein C0467_20905 [Planctomycetaceae bacterium]|nr:hypothetical protein [Planctomycetaceae bacterium]